MSAQDYTQLITSEHSQQPQFMELVALWTSAVADITNLIDSMPALFDLDQAIGAQQDVLGLWIGLNRAVGGILLIEFFGFGDDASALGFGELTNPAAGGRFYELGEPSVSTAILADPEYQILLKAKILQNQWDGSGTEFQEALYAVLGIPFPTQLVTNGDFSNNNTGWSGSGPSELAPTQVLALPNSGSPTSTYGDFIYRNAFNGSIFPVQAEQQYAVSSYSSASSSGGYLAQVGLELNGPGQPAVFVGAYTIPAGAMGWAFYSGIIDIPAGYTSAQVWVYNAGPDNTVLPDWFHTNVSIVPWDPFIFDPGTNCVLIAPQNAVDPVLAQLLLNYDIIPRTAGSRYQYLFPFAPPFSWTTNGTAVASGTTITKPTGASAWDSAAWIAQPSTKIFVQWVIGANTTEVMCGLATNPATSPNFPSLNYGIFLNSTTHFTAYASGNAIGPAGSYAAGDTFGVYFDGESAVFLQNNIPFYVLPVASTPGALNPMFCMYQPGSVVEDITIWTGS